MIADNQYMGPSELVTRSMIAMSEAMDFVVTDKERTVAHDLDRRVVGRIRNPQNWTLWSTAVQGVA